MKKLARSAVKTKSKTSRPVRKAAPVRRSSSSSSNSWMNGYKFVLFIPLILLAMGVILFADKISNKPAIREYCNRTEEFITKNQGAMVDILTNQFDYARSCSRNQENCNGDVSKAVLSQLTGTRDLPYFASTYFIRKGDGDEIEKLFLSGNYEVVKVDNGKTRQVSDVLMGRHSKICDQGFKVDIQTTSMTYLHDFPGEAEIIIPVKANDQIIGAVVKTWGD